MSKRNINSDLSWELQGKLGQMAFAKAVVSLAPTPRRDRKNWVAVAPNIALAQKQAERILAEIEILERQLNSIYYGLIFNNQSKGNSK